MIIEGVTIDGGMILSPPPVYAGLTLSYQNANNVGFSLGGTQPLNNPYSIDWGDGNIDSGVVGSYVQFSHTYATTSNYVIQITGNINRFDSTYFGTPQAGVDKLKEVIQWGNLPLNQITFAYANNLTNVPNTLPTTILFLSATFNVCDNFNDANLTLWNTSNVTSMFFTFSGASTFNQNIGNWNVGNVTNMDNMFTFATNFNQNLSAWTTGLTTQPSNFSLNANATFANNASNLKPYLQDGVTRINT